MQERARGKGASTAAEHKGHESKEGRGKDEGRAGKRGNDAVKVVLR